MYVTLVISNQWNRSQKSIPALTSKDSQNRRIRMQKANAFQETKCHHKQIKENTSTVEKGKETDLHISWQSVDEEKVSDHNPNANSYTKPKNPQNRAYDTHIKSLPKTISVFKNLNTKHTRI